MELRLFNPSDAEAESRVSLGFGVAVVQATRLDGTPLESIPTTRRRGRTVLTVKVPPTGFVTLRLTPQPGRVTR